MYLFIEPHLKDEWLQNCIHRWSFYLYYVEEQIILYQQTDKILSKFKVSLDTI